MDLNLAALAALASSTEVATLLQRLEALQRKNDALGTWDNPVARRVEAAASHLRMALEFAAEQG